MITDHPAAVRTSATVEPPGPEPMMTASQSRSATLAPPDLGVLAALDLLLGVAARLDVAEPADHLPPDFVAVAAIDRIAVHPFARVLVEQPQERRDRRKATVLLGVVDIGEVGAERGDAVAVHLLEADDLTVELALGLSVRPFDAGAPRQLLHAAERQPLREVRFAAPPPGERATGVDARG